MQYTESEIYIIHESKCPCLWILYAYYPFPLEGNKLNSWISSASQEKSFLIFQKQISLILGLSHIWKKEGKDKGKVHFYNQGHTTVTRKKGMQRWVSASRIPGTVYHLRALLQSPPFTAEPMEGWRCQVAHPKVMWWGLTTRLAFLSFHLCNRY